MTPETLHKTQFDEIKTTLKAYCLSSYGKQNIEASQPSSNLALVKNRLKETEEARHLLEANLHMPFMGISQIEHLTNQIEKGFILEPADLIDYADFLRSGRLIRRFMEKNQSVAPQLANYSQGLHTFEAVEAEIYQTIKNNQISSDASRELRKVRRGIQECEAEIEQKLSKFLRNSSNQTKIQEFFVVKKNERFTIPIKASYKNQISGTIVETSSKGTTVFIEPSGVAKLNDKLFSLKLAESAEIYQIQSTLTGVIAEQMPAIHYNIEVIAEFDMIFARGKYSRDRGGMTPKVNKNGQIHLIDVYHPLLGADGVPLNLILGNQAKCLTITGPNAGGKTVVLKTLGLITLQVMFGLQIQGKPGTEVAIFDQLFVDIGDQQSIENALSTFSGHMKNISDIMAKTTANSLILLDELGSGTEPNEGAALAIAIMEALYLKGATLITTTHYGEIKRYSEQHPAFTTAAMAFDAATLTPRYQLIMGETGESNAFWIANQMKLAPAVVKQAEKYLDNRVYDLTLRAEKPQMLEPSVSATTEKALIDFSQGDRVRYLETNQVGLVYQVDQVTQRVQILLEEQLVTVQPKRLVLLAKAQELYPDNYDMASLFTNYHERKQQRDLERGSKKAQKQLQKEMRQRQTTKE